MNTQLQQYTYYMYLIVWEMHIYIGAQVYRYSDITYTNLLIGDHESKEGLTVIKLMPYH